MNDYEKVVGVNIDTSKITESIEILKTSGVPYEFRSTLVPGLHEANDILQMSKDISGAEKWFLQKFKSDTDLVDMEFREQRSFTDLEMQELCEIAKKEVPNCKIRD